MANHFEAGVLLHISSLPGKYGIGQIGQSAYNFIDFLSDCGFSYWEILPLSPTSFSNSPYQTSSAFAFNQFYIDYDLLINDGLLNSRDFQGLSFYDNTRKVNFLKVFKYNNFLLTKAFKRFDKNNYEFLKFKNNELYEPYSIYMTLKEMNGNKAWYNWKLEDRYYSDEVRNDVLNNHKDRVDFYYFIQFMFLKQREKLHNYAKSKNIKIIGEIPHFLDFDSASIYMYSEEFLLNKFNMMDIVAGFPPDEFTKVGQRWGEPLYDWSYMKTTHYKWWRKRIYQALNTFDMVKINHFSGFYKAYGLPFKEKSNKIGSFYFGPGLELFNEFKDSNILASDLGVYFKDVEKFVKQTGFTTLKTIVLPLFKQKKVYEKFYPSVLEYNNLAYIGNHDNNMLRARIEELSKDGLRDLNDKIQNEAKLLKVDFERSESTRYLAIKIIELLLASKAHYVTLMMQDILYQGKESRMNYPGTISDNNWSYRFLNSDITKNLKLRIKELLTKYNRSQD